MNFFVGCPLPVPLIQLVALIKRVCSTCTISSHVGDRRISSQMSAWFIFLGLAQSGTCVKDSGYFYDRPREVHGVRVGDESAEHVENEDILLKPFSLCLVPSPPPLRTEPIKTRTTPRKRASEHLRCRISLPRTTVSVSWLEHQVNYSL